MEIKYKRWNTIMVLDKKKANVGGGVNLSNGLTPSLGRRL